MKKNLFLTTLLLLLAHGPWSMVHGPLLWAQAQTCNVERPDQFRNQIRKLLAGECNTLQFTRTMDIYLETSLLLEGRSHPIEITADPEVTVRLIGWAEGNTTPGIRIKRKNVTLRNLSLRDFLGPAIQIEAPDVTLENLEIAHNEGRGVSVLQGEGVLIVNCVLHHNGRAAVFWDADAEVIVSQVSFYENGTGIEVEGPHLPAPAALRGIPSNNQRLTVSGTIPLSRAEDDPYRLGPVRYADLVVEIYLTRLEEGAQGKEFIGTAETADGTFQAEFSLPNETWALTAMTVNEVMGVSSPFSEPVLIGSVADEDEDVEEEEESEELNPIPSDSDGDGLPDTEEIDRLGTDPLKCDSDEDRLGDGLETGIIHPQAASPDCRGLLTAGTNFARPRILDPLNPDSDGDGLPDGGEDQNQNGWLDADETDPTLDDTDSDGLEDGVEMLLDKNRDGQTDIDIRSLANGPNCSPPLDKNDLDCDGFVNARDLDTDNDGCLDSEEDRLDKNEDGILDVWDAQAKACSLSSPSTPSPSVGVPNDVSQDKSDEKVLPSEVIPARGGGACSFHPEMSDQKSKRTGWIVLGLLFGLCLWRQSPGLKMTTQRKGRKL